MPWLTRTTVWTLPRGLKSASSSIQTGSVAATDPVWMQLEADFNPRGNVHTVVRVSHGTRQPC